MAGAEDPMLPVPRVDMVTDDVDVCAVTTTREEARMARGRAVLFPLGAGFTLDGHSAAGATLRIPLEAAAALAEEYTGLPAAELRFEPMAAVSDAARGLFAQTTAFICGELHIPPLTRGTTERRPWPPRRRAGASSSPARTRPRSGNSCTRSAAPGCC